MKIITQLWELNLNTGQLHDPVWDQTTSYVGSQLWNRLGAQLRDQFEEFEDQLEAELRNRSHLITVDYRVRHP
jgi:hypothetical protein